ncbi:hypothetical protein D7V21_02800 [Acinetobacter guerrae]|uniref:Protein kinase domain-containing protein n=1 Tax=Acinetobacter guerrae TaxID=1843371 RepID=A0A3A8F0H8_9GAMM|nr:protein kinase [Acinetobacter guerrae]RKG35814.1 hypothetical protein D7V21_02800 [Acinetobacter guerrae]
MLKDFEHLTLNTKPKSLELGRRLYTFEYQRHCYWLKLQRLDSNAMSTSGFKHELNFYQQMKDSADFILPVQFIQLDEFLQEKIVTWGIMLPHADSYFKEQVSSLSLLEIKHHLHRALVGLGKLHRSGWIHGDLKAEHIVQYQQRVCLIDFEQSQLSHINDSITMTATPHYMAPELFHGSPKTIQSDLYALGIIFYEWLTQTGLSANSYMQWAVLHCQQLKIKLPTDLECFESLLNGLLSKQQNNRFNDVNQALTILNLTKPPI